MDKLKKYLHVNRDKLDVNEFSIDENWPLIQQKLKAKTGRIILYRWIAAASFIACVSVSLIMLVTTKQNSDKGLITQSKKENKMTPSQDPVTLIINNKSIIKDSSLVNIAQRKIKIKTNRITTKPTELELMDRSFQTIIYEQLKLVRTTPFYAESPDYFSYFKKEYAVLEREESELKRKVKQYGMNELFLDNLITIYQGKLSLLKKLKTEIQQMNNRIKQSDPDVSYRKPVYINI